MKEWAQLKKCVSENYDEMITESNNHAVKTFPQPVYTCSELTIKTLEQSVKYV